MVAHGPRVVPCRANMNFSTSAGPAVIQPRRSPGARNLQQTGFEVCEMSRH